MPASPLTPRSVHTVFDSSNAVGECAATGASTGVPSPRHRLDRRGTAAAPPGSRHRRMRTAARRRWRAALLLLAAYVALYAGALDWLPLQRRGLVALDLDIVSVAVKPTCINRAALTAVRRYLRPRTIHVVTATQPQCDVFESWAPNIRCHLQDSFLPGLTRQGVAEALERRFGASGGSTFRGRDLAGWYLQQFIKLGAAGALPGLSRHFVVWDADMVPLRPLRLFCTPRRRLGQGAPVQTVVNVGGASAPGYAATYQRLFGEPLERAPDGSSFVTHWMVVYQPYLQEFLSAVAGNSSGSTSGTNGGGSTSSSVASAVDTSSVSMAAFAEAVFGAVSPETLHLGFSEYASYVSWVRRRHPHSQRLARRRTWLRYGLGGEAAVRLARALSFSGLCCPPRSVLLWSRLLGYQYTGYEAGHVPECRYNSPEHQLSYGVSL